MKEIWLDENLYDISLRIEEELCRQVNNGMIRNPEEIGIIRRFISNAKS